VNGALSLVESSNYGGTLHETRDQTAMCVPVDGLGEFERALSDSIAGERARMIVVRASLKPPPTTSPRWYRKR
jgi:hypothetical protein